MPLSDEDKQKQQRLKANFVRYAAECLNIRAKDGTIVPFVLNDIQKRLHATAEDQFKRTGRVRLLVLKARQPGVSTYVEGRFYHLATHIKGLRAFILTHKDEATDNLFEMAKRFQALCPEFVRPRVTASNAPCTACGSTAWRRCGA